MLYIRPTHGGKLLLRKWIEELQAQPWSERAKANDQPAFNWALNKTADMVCFGPQTLIFILWCLLHQSQIFAVCLQVKLYLLPQEAFPSGGLYFKNETWRSETRGKQAIVHNNYITGFEKKIKRFRDFNLWSLDDGDDTDPTEALLKFRSSVL